MKAKRVIGYTEFVDFPAWGIEGVEAKVDTGARTSALHVENLRLLADGHVRFDVVTGNGSDGRVAVEVPAARWDDVRSSNGIVTHRCFVRTEVVLGDIRKQIEISLVSRSGLRYRMLLGRSALRRDFVVDVGKRHRLKHKNR